MVNNAEKVVILLKRVGTTVLAIEEANYYLRGRSIKPRRWLG